MPHEIGEITRSDGGQLLRMWRVDVEGHGKRDLRRHSHIRFEITLVTRGSGTYTTDNAVYPIAEGDMFIFCGNEQHCITEVGDNGLEIINLHFEPRYLLGSQINSLSVQNSTLCFAHNTAFENRIPADRAAVLRTLFLNIRQELSARQAEYALTVKSYVNLLLITLIRDFDYAARTEPLSRDKLHHIRRGIAYIDDHLCETLSLRELSERVGLSPNYFCTLFRQVCGITVWEYINSKRIDKAIYLLHTEKDRNILDIALACGFNNTANFNKVFRQHTGTVPHELRNSADIAL